ncbi:hypothetical protein HG530_012334 [Fusarium avenaceum]|nr:hypothetical protein HG530_012334 [Fusarium avenaceum]
MGFSEIAVYVLGLACIARSIMAFTNPQAEYELNGLKHTLTSRSSPTSGPIYMLGLWELSVGVLLVLNQANSNLAGIITLLTLMSLYKASVAFLLWNIGDDNRESDQDNEGHRSPVEVARVVSAAHTPKTVGKLDANDDNLQSDKELSNVLETDSQPSVENATVLAISEEGLFERRYKSKNDTKGGAEGGGADELSRQCQTVLDSWMKFVPNCMLGLSSTARRLFGVSRERSRCIIMASPVAQVPIHSIDRILVTDSKKSSPKSKGKHVGNDRADEEERLGSVDDSVTRVIVRLCEIDDQQRGEKHFDADLRDLSARLNAEKLGLACNDTIEDGEQNRRRRLNGADKGAQYAAWHVKVIWENWEFQWE